MDPVVPQRARSCQNAHMARRRRRVLGGLLLLVVAIVLVLGRGLGLLPTTAESGSESGDGATTPAAPPGAGARPAGPAHGDTAPAPGEDDRTASLRSAVRTALADGRLGAAFAVLQGFAAPAARELERQARDRLAAVVHLLEGEIAAGEVLAAHRRLLLLLDTPSADVEAALDAVAAARGWPSLRSRTRAPGDVPPAEPLPADRAVRAVLPSGQTLRSRIVARFAEGATLRSSGPDGVTFPTVPWWQLEPEAATAAEAAELGFAALGAEQVLLARVWCACGLSRPAEGTARLQQLRELLPQP
jgi:hypothetical protein